MENFWREMRKAGPVLCLAPMADVTDSAFRFIISKYSDIPHVTWTEFVSADGLALAPEEGRRKLLKDLEYTDSERPIVAQFFTSRPENMEKAARLSVELGFDGVDINMGCPDKSIEKQGAGAALIKSPQVAKELIRAAKKGTQGKIPVSIKTRLGYNRDELEEWLPELLAEEPAAITIHARTRKEMSKVPAQWERVRRAVEIRDALPHPPTPLLGKERGATLILGNGDVLDVQDAFKKCEETGADGVMLGRAIFGNPTLFSKNKILPVEKLKIAKEHTELFDVKLGGMKSFAIMKKHYKAYAKDFDGANELRHRLMESTNSAEATQVLQEFIKNNGSLKNLSNVW